MPLPNIFDKQVTDSLIIRIQKLTPETKPQWGKMSVEQMLAHANVTYSYVYEPEKYKPVSFPMKLIMKAFVKKIVVGEAPFKRNSQTAPDFIVKDEKDFQKEKDRLIGFLLKTQALGSDHFDGKNSHSFGKLNATEWNNMFYKHLDHHLRQFGV